MTTRFRASDWLLVSGGLLMLMASVLPWWKVTWGGRAPQATFDAFDFVATGIVPLVLFLGVAVAIVIIKTESLRLPTALVHPVVTAAAVGLGSILVAARFVWSGFDETQGVSRGIGLYVAGAAVVVCVAGCVLSFREETAPGDERDDDAVFDDDDHADDIEDVDVGVVEGDDLIGRYSAPAPGAPGAAPRPPRTPTRATPRPRRQRDTSTSAPPRSRRRPATPPGP